MTVVTGTLPYDVDNLLSGAARVIISDDSQPALPAIPANLKDVFAQISPYAPLTGWLDVGATIEATSYSREFGAEGYEIQQTNAEVLQDLTELSRQLSVAIGEVKPEHIKIFEEAKAITTVAAVAGAMAQKHIKFGSIQNLTKRRVLFVGQRNIASGQVTETVGSIKRGRFVAFCLYNVVISGDSSEVEMGKGGLASLPLTFTAFPEGGQLSGEEYGKWITEDAGVMT